MKIIIKWDINTDGDFGFMDYYTRSREKYGYDGEDNYCGIQSFDKCINARMFLEEMLSNCHVTSSHYYLLKDIYKMFENLINVCNSGKIGSSRETFSGNADGYISVDICIDKEEEKLKDYYVSYSGRTIVRARDEDEACEVAIDKISIDEVNAYEMDKDGNLIGI